MTAYFLKNEEDIEKYLSSFFQTYTKSWDVFLLGGRIFKYEDTEFSHIKKITYSNLAHSYVVNRHYLSVLRECFIGTIEKMRYDLFSYQSFSNCIDFAWEKLAAKRQMVCMQGVNNSAVPFI